MAIYDFTQLKNSARYRDPHLISHEAIITLLDEDLADSSTLHNLSLHMLLESDLPALYGRIVEAARALLRSDFASLQMVRTGRDGQQVLELIAHHGFTPHAAEHWGKVRINSATSCANAWVVGSRVIVPDVETHEPFANTIDLAVFRETGIRSTQTTPLRSRDGAVIGMMSTHWKNVHTPTERQLLLFDILARQAAGLIERAQAEAALRLSESRLRALVTSSSYALFRMSPDWKQMHALDGHGFLANTVSSNPNWLEAYIYPEDREDVLRTIAAAIETRSMFDLEHRVIRADGNPGWAQSRAVPILDDAGEIVEWFGAASDVTSRKETERALREGEQRLRLLHRMKDQFLATLAHELRNPLAPIRNGLQFSACETTSQTLRRCWQCWTGRSITWSGSSTT